MEHASNAQTVSDLRRALRASEERFHLLASSVQDCAFYTLNQQGRVVSWNVGAQHLKGYTDEEILGKHFSIFYSNEDKILQIPARELALASTEGHCEAEGWRTRKDGSKFLANIVLTAIKDDQGLLLGFARVTRNISGHRQLEERFHQVVESAPSAMVMINNKGIIEMVNAQTEHLFGYLRAELLGQPVEVLIPADFHDHHPALRTSFFANPASRPMGKGRDLYASHKNGDRFPVEIGLNPMETNEGTKVLSTIVDISDRKEKERKIEAALAENNILLAEIHHRVKNNLQIVSSLLDLQSAQINDPVILEMFRESKNRINSMALIHQMLYQSNDFSKVNLSHVLQELVPTLVESYGAERGSIIFSVNTEEVFIPLNLAIPCSLAVNELITNALKHAFPNNSKGEVSIDLLKQKDNVLLSVTDTGVGIPSELDLQKTESLGLQLVQLLVDQIGGELSIERANPTRFMISFSPMVKSTTST